MVSWCVCSVPVGKILFDLKTSDMTLYYIDVYVVHISQAGVLTIVLQKFVAEVL
jgi:hypothetical protein